MKLEEGKLKTELLEKHILGNITYKRDDVSVRAGIGEDCAVMDFGSHEAVISIDPITAAIENIGELAVHVGCNDIAANGVAPAFIVLTLLLPIGTEIPEIDRIMKQAGCAAASLGVEIVGGHTEITSSVTQPIMIMAAIGKRLKPAEVRIAPKAGDGIYMTKYAAMEGIGILAADFPQELSAFLSSFEIDEARKLLNHISVVREGVIGGECGISLMHDATEGGIFGALIEMCTVAGTGAEIDVGAIPIPSAGKKIADALGIEILRMISSGCMLMAVPEELEHMLNSKMKDAGIKFTKIGKLVEASGVVANRNDVRSIVEPQENDELYKAVKKLTEEKI